MLLGPMNRAAPLPRPFPRNAGTGGPLAPRAIIFLMDSAAEQALREADRESAAVTLVFADGGAVRARIRDVDWVRHRVVTYLDEDRSCRAFTADLDSIIAVRR